MKMKKLGYRKSRNGCVLCKRRRVKCDEQRPCSACIRHGVPCSLGNSSTGEGLSPSQASHRSSPRTQTVNTPSSTTSSSNRTNYPPPSTRSEPPSYPLDDLSLNVSFLHPSPSPSTTSPPSPDHSPSTLLDLELMHNYTLATYNSFPHTLIVPHFWQVKVPHLALRHPFLLHQVLAVSGFHLIHKTPSLPDTYLRRATHHLTKSLSAIRTALEAEMTMDSGTALFAASSLLLSSTYASRQHLPAEGLIDDLVGMVALFRGTSSVLNAATKTLSTDLVKDVFGQSLNGPPEVGPWVTEYINNLKNLNTYLSTLPDLSEPVRATAIKGTEVLINAPWTLSSTDRAITSSVEVRILYRWPFSVDPDFLQMMRDNEPAVLTVFLFYCAVMRKAEETCWFLKGWGLRLRDAVTKPLEGTPWLEQARWALDVIETG